LKMTDQELISYHKKATNQSLNQKSLCFYTGAFFFEDLLKTYRSLEDCTIRGSSKIL
jgi:hypothetical protein